MAYAIHVTGLRKYYRQGSRDVHALKGIDLTVADGEFLAIMGASGSGKSTLLHLCAALDRPSGGEIEVAGASLQRMSERELTLFRRRQIGIIFQSFNLIPTLTARENIALPALLDGSYCAKHQAHIQQLLEILQIDHRADHRPDAMSGGEQQRVAIARALVMEPPVLFADEPTGNLDSNSARQFWELLNLAAGRFKTTVMMVTHEPGAAMHADRVIVLRDGVVSGEFPVEKLDDAGELASRYQTMAR